MPALHQRRDGKPFRISCECPHERESLAAQGFREVSSRTLHGCAGLRNVPPIPSEGEGALERASNGRVGDEGMIERVDVLVAGGGPSGVAAAIASGRAGARTLIVERYGRLGGTAVNVTLNLFQGPSLRREDAESMPNQVEHKVSHYGNGKGEPAFAYAPEGQRANGYALRLLRPTSPANPPSRAIIEDGSGTT